VKEAEPASAATLSSEDLHAPHSEGTRAKPLIEAIKASKLKVNAQYQDEQIRISGKSKDDLQKRQSLLEPA